VTIEGILKVIDYQNKPVSLVSDSDIKVTFLISKKEGATSQIQISSTGTV